MMNLPVSTYSIVIIVLAVMSIVIFCVGAYCICRAKDLAPLHHGIADAQKTLQDLNADILKLQSELKSAQQDIAEGKVWKDWLDNNRDTCASLRTQIEKTKQELTEVTKAFQEKDKDYQEIQQKLQTAMSDLQKTQLDCELTSRKLEDVKRDLSVKEPHLKLLEKEINEKTATLASLNAKLAALDENIARLKEEISQKNAQKSVLEKDIANAKAELAGLGVKIKEHGVQIAQFEETAKNKWADLDRPVIDGSRKRTPQRIDENSWLAAFKSNLASCGINFHERSINAFHTALKVADESPLTVLAGISGTGKSLLPSLYAQAIGMNFLQIAVQPRWDGPQDMFGFYNYMESRYKATELSRLLWQFDCFNNKKLQSIEQGQMPMNLILLDEMNLARVEYYFSDMLSKLEVRRGIDPKDEIKRRNAEVEIECPINKKGDVGQNARRLFVGPNNLFVGTMNEDETTQTLSDKVVDRSNVLRFGQPAKLDAHPDISKFNSCYGAYSLDYETWRTKWHTKGRDSDVKNALITMSDINNQMARIGRPFAYRVWLAMEAYIRNYPASGQLKWAIADQIEMKILPKLNGLDKSDKEVIAVLNHLQDVISNQNDAELVRAFEVCRNSGDMFFQWRGVRRS